MNHGFFRPASERRRSGAGCLILSSSSGRLLMCLRSHRAPSPHVWSVWGGRAEVDESAEETARREVFEETGLKIEGPLEHIHDQTTFGFRYDTFLCVVEREFTPHLTSEADGYCWVPPELIPTPMHSGLADLLADRLASSRLERAVERFSGRRSHLYEPA